MPASPLVVQAVTDHNSAAAFLAVPVTATTAGNLVVTAVQAYSATPVTGLAVSNVTLGGDTVTQAFSQTVQAGNWVSAVWLDAGCSGGLTAVDVTLSGSNASTQLNVIAWEISGWLAGYPLDILTSTFSLTPASSWSLAASDTQAGVLWIGTLTSEGGPAFTVTGPSSPWATNGAGAISNSVSPAFTRMQGWTNPQATQGPVTFSGSFSGSENWAAILLAVPGSVTPGATTWAVSDPAGGSAGQAGVWGCPPGTPAVSAAVTAAGGGGGGGSNTALGGGGGGGGEHALSPALGTAPGALCAWGTGLSGQGGAGGTSSSGQAGTAGGNAFFTGATQTVTATGGSGGAGGSSSAGTGGAGGSGSTAPTHFSGGGGSSGTTTSSGGGGGGSGGTGSAGNSASGSPGAAAVTGGGPGGTGGHSTAEASMPASGPGGGGGGGLFVSGSAEPGAAGWAGQVALSYTITPSSPALITPGPQAARRASFW